MSVKQISVFLENKPGALYAMTGVLAQQGGYAGILPGGDQ